MHQLNTGKLRIFPTECIVMFTANSSPTKLMLFPWQISISCVLSVGNTANVSIIFRLILSKPWKRILKKCLQHFLHSDSAIRVEFRWFNIRHLATFLMKSFEHLINRLSHNIAKVTLYTNVVYTSIRTDILHFRRHTLFTVTSENEIALAKGGKRPPVL
jgi:hypothetical protein